MKNKAILTLLVDKQEVFKVGPNQLSPRGCEFFCNDSQVDLFRDGQDDRSQKRYARFQIRLGLFPHAGPVPQYLTALGQVVSVRRKAQDCFCVALQFEQVSAGGYRLIAEHLSDSEVVCIDSVKTQTA